MSIWSDLKKFAQPYSDDEYDDYDEDETSDTYDDEEPEEQPTRARRTPAFSIPTTSGGHSSSEATSAPGNVSSSFNGQVINVGNKQEVVLFRPVTFNDASKAADHLRNKRAVIVNMENVDKAMSRRVVDFLTGCAYAVDGKVKKVAQSTYLFCPHNMEIVGDLENLQNEVESYI